MIYGYARVSTKDQNLDRQLIALTSAGVPLKNIYTDKASGKDFERENYQKLLSNVHRGDLIIIKSIDRLGRDYEEIQAQWRLITKTKQVDIKVLDMPLLDTTYCKDIMGTFISDLILQILSFMAQTERDYIHQRQLEGIAAAKAKGVTFGRPRIPNPENWDELVTRFKNGESVYSLKKDCDQFSYSTLRQRLLDVI